MLTLKFYKNAETNREGQNGSAVVLLYYTNQNYIKEYRYELQDMSTSNNRILNLREIHLISDWEFKDKIEYNISSEENSLSINEVTDKPFTVTEINKCTKKLKTGKSTGPDLI